MRGILLGVVGLAAALLVAAWYFPRLFVAVGLTAAVLLAIWYYSRRPAPREYAERPPTAIGRWLSDQDNRCYVMLGLTILAFAWAIAMGAGEPLIPNQLQKLQTTSQLALNEEHARMLRYWYGDRFPTVAQPAGFLWSWKWWILAILLALATVAYRLWTYREELARLWSQTEERARGVVEAFRTTRQGAAAAPPPPPGAPTPTPAQPQSETRVFIREVAAAMLPEVGRLLFDWRRRR